MTRGEQADDGQPRPSHNLPAVPEPWPKSQRGRGRPEQYLPEYCDKVVELASVGMGKAEIAATIGVVRSTLDDWAERHAEFSDAMTRAHEMSLAWWSAQGRSGIWAGSQFNANAYSLQVRNRFPADYRDKQEQVLTGPNGGAVEIRTELSLGGLDADERSMLREILARRVERSEGGPSGA